MAVDITALYCCLDDFCKGFEDWEAHRLIPSAQTRTRPGKLSRAEMLFIMVLFHLSAYKNFKTFYLHGIGCQYRACFRDLPHYDRFISRMPRLFVPLMVLLHSLSGGPSQVWGSGGNGRLRVCIVSGSESLSEAGAERPIVDGAANLEQKISPSPRPTHLL